MTNIYVFCKASSTPSGWTRTTTYDGKYVRMGDAYGEHGSTGGAANHTHTVNSATLGNSSAVGVSSSASSYLGAIHAGHTITVGDLGTEDNDPSYYTLSLIYQDLTTFESTTKSFPADAVVAATGAITHDDFTRFSDADSKFIKLGDPASTGGRDNTTAGHSISSNTSGFFNGDSSAYRRVTGGGTETAHGIPSFWNHQHAAGSGNSGTATTHPKKVTTRLYRANKATTSIPVNVVCFFDGAPSANWTAITSWNDGCLFGGDSDPSVTGADTHSHSNFSFNTYAPSGTDYATTAGSSQVCQNPHSHPVTVSLADGNHLPPYVTLVPYYLNTVISLQQTLTKTWDLDIVLKRVATKTADADIVLKKGFNKTADVDVVLKKGFSKTADVDVVLKKGFSKTADTDLVIKKVQNKTADADVVLKKGFNKTADADVVLKNGFNKTADADVVLKKAMTITANVDLLLKKMQSKTVSFDVLLEQAKTKTYETDFLLKKMQSKTFEIDALISIMKEADIDNDMIIKVVQNKTLEMGIGFKAFIEFPYNMDVILKSVKGAAYEMDMLALKRDIPLTYDIDFALVKQLTTDFNYDVIIKGFFDKAVEYDLLMRKALTKTYDADILIEDQFEKQCDADIIIKNVFDKSFNMDTLMRKALDASAAVDILIQTMFYRKVDYDIRIRDTFSILVEYDIELQKAFSTAYNLDAIFKKGFNAEIDYDVLMRSMAYSQVDVDITVRKAFNALLSIDIALQMAHNKTYAEDILIKKAINGEFDLDMSIIYVPRAFYSANMNILGARVLFYGSDMLTLKRGIGFECSYDIKLIPYNRRFRRPRLTPREPPAIPPIPSGSAYNETKLYPILLMRETAQEALQEAREMSGSAYNRVKEINYNRKPRPGQDEL